MMLDMDSSIDGRWGRASELDSNGRMVEVQRSLIIET